jgi:acetolactate synthase-1/2/3 large subunit
VGCENRSGDDVGEVGLVRLTGGQIVTEMLKAYGVRYVFGVPGDTSLALYDALCEAQGVIEHILARDERSAAFMADAYARVSGQPGVCEAPGGAGATYLAAGLAEAYASSIPVIAVTSDNPLGGEERNYLGSLDQPALFAPITKWCVQVKRTELIADAVRQAFRVATSGRPGAVQLTLPMDLLAEEVEGPLLRADPTCQRYPSYRTRPDPASVRRAVELLTRATRPVIVAGGGAVISKAWDEVTSLAEALGAPVGTSISGKGAIGENHPLSIGVVGNNGGRPYANRLLEAADLILFVGCKTDSVTTSRWKLPSSRTSQAILHVDVDPAEIGRNYPATLGVVGDARLALADLVTAVLACDTKPHASPLASAAQQVASFWAEFESKAKMPSTPIKPQRVVQTLDRLLPQDRIVVADAGTPTPFVAAYLRSSTGRQVIIPRGYGGLGYVIPGVIGAKLARPQASVVGLMGDGSFGTSGSELETVGRLGLPVTLIQFNNGCFGWIKAKQRLLYNGRYFGVDFSTTTDYAEIARSFGLRARRIENPDDLEAALQVGLTSDAATFIDVLSESEVTELPPVSDWQVGTCVESAISRPTRESG